MSRSHDSDCHLEPITRVVDAGALERSTGVLLGITGLGCPTCATRVRNSLLSLPGVVRAEIDLVHGLARINYDATLLGHKELLKAVSDAGDGGKHTYQAFVIE